MSLRVNQLSGFGAHFRRPASFVFNNSDERLNRQLLTSGASTTIFTYSMWVWFLTGTFATNEPLWGVSNSDTNTGLTDLTRCGKVSDSLELVDFASSAVAWGEEVDDLETLISEESWHHLVMRYDSTQGTADDRIRLYLDGALQTDTDIGGTPQPSLNQAHHVFANSYFHNIGYYPELYFGGKLAFIDVLEGVSAAPTDFAFDNGGTWTRKRYAGSYGTYGFSLDGSRGFDDASDNGQHFTGINMTVGANLDYNDLPPWTA